MIQDFEILIDWQQRGMNARILGLRAEECPQPAGLLPVSWTSS